MLQVDPWLKDIWQLYEARNRRARQDYRREQGMTIEPPRNQSGRVRATKQKR